MVKKEYENIKRHSTPLIEALERTDFYATDNVIESPWEISNCISIMQSLYNERILLVRGYEILFDSDQKDNSGVITNDVVGNWNHIVVDADERNLDEAYKKKETILSESENKLQVVIPIIKEEDSFEKTGFLVVLLDKKEINTEYNLLKQKVFAISGIILALLFVTSLVFSNYIVKPIKELISYIEKITDGFLGEKFTIKSYTEIEEVVDSINHMTTKLETLESSRQEFVSNVSHELKTPITSIKVLADSLLQQEDAPAELYREFLTDINDEIERENKIITDLLSLVKLDKTSGELNIESIKINELLEQILRRIKPIAAKRNIELILESYRPVVAEVDEVKLSLAINNLIENAVKYNFDNGWVRVSLNADHKFFYIKVSDSGVGIPEDEQENVFERFYRVDKARSRETGGTGLGLSITRNAILMHRGAIKIYSKEQEGTTFTVRIPLAHARKSEA